MFWIIQTFGHPFYLSNIIKTLYFQTSTPSDLSAGVSLSEALVTIEPSFFTPSWFAGKFIQWFLSHFCTLKLQLYLECKTIPRNNDQLSSCNGCSGFKLLQICKSDVVLLSTSYTRQPANTEQWRNKIDYIGLQIMNCFFIFLGILHSVNDAKQNLNSVLNLMLHYYRWCLHKRS